MSDGRSFTAFHTRCSASSGWRGVQERPMSSNETRRFLTSNADSIMQRNRDQAEKNNLCGSCFDQNQSGTMLPELEMQSCNKRTCTFPLNDHQGLGMGRKAE